VKWCIGGLCALLLYAGWRFGPVEQRAVLPTVYHHNNTKEANGAAMSHASSASAAGISLKTQLPYAIVPDEALGLPADLRATFPPQKLPQEITGRRVPELTLFSELDSPELTNRVVPLPEANTLAHLNFQERRFGRLQTGAGEATLFNPETVLVKFRALPLVGALRVEPMREWDAIRALRRREDVQFAELDVFERRQFSPDDPLIGSQWHHQVIGSFQAWDHGLGQPFVRIAIVDTPFQMDHPDLAANTISGWDVVTNGPVNSSTGIVHSTMCAGMAAAVIGNGLGVAGAANCEALPININGVISDMYKATIWAADHDVRVVNISWSGADSDTLESAGVYLKNKARGILVMSALDGSGPSSYTNQPDIYCISMTDAADNFTGTMYGPYIDFAAPGWQIYSTTTGGGFTHANGTSYAAPLFSGVVAWVMSLNPTLGPDEVIDILKNTVADLGQPGWDQFFGWGRINFGAAATATLATLPVISSIQATNSQVVVSANFRSSVSYSLWKTPGLNPVAWAAVTNATLQTNGSVITLTDPTPAAGGSFYKIRVALP
jgi:hypothetical protein